MITKKQLLKKLNDSQITFQLHEHEALFTVRESEKKRGGIKGIHTKNLFLKNKKKEYFLFSCEESRSVDLKKLSKTLSLGNLSFANEDALKEFKHWLGHPTTQFFPCPPFFNDKKGKWNPNWPDQLEFKKLKPINLSVNLCSPFGLLS